MIEVKIRSADKMFSSVPAWQADIDAYFAKLRDAADDHSAVDKVAARAVLNLCKAHLIRKNLTGSHEFWGEAAESVRTDFTGVSAKVVIPRQGMHWQRYGGTHTAKPGHAIAINLRDEDDGVWPSEKFGRKGADPDVFVYRRPSSDKAFLARREGGALRLYYILLKSVSKGPDASVLPSSASTAAAAQKASASYMRRAIRHAANT